VNGAPALVCTRGEKPLALMTFAFSGGRVAEIDILRRRANLAELDRFLAPR